MAPKGKWAKHQAAVLSLGVVIGWISLLYPRDIELLGLAFVDAAQQLRGPRRVAGGNIILYCHANCLQDKLRLNLNSWPKNNYLEKRSPDANITIFISKFFPHKATACIGSASCCQSYQNNESHPRQPCGDKSLNFSKSASD